MTAVARPDATDVLDNPLRGWYSVGETVRYLTSFGLKGTGTVLGFEGPRLVIGVARTRDGQWFTEIMSHSAVFKLDGSGNWLREAICVVLASESWLTSEEIGARLVVGRASIGGAMTELVRTGRVVREISRKVSDKVAKARFALAGASS